MTVCKQQTVLVLGGTGRTGRRVIEQLLSRGLTVRAIVRSASKLPPGLAEKRNLVAIEADLLSLIDEELERHVRDCDAVISCLGHVLDLKGIFGAPRDLVTRAMARLCRAIEASKPATPIKLILMSSVSVHRPGAVDARRGGLERTFLWLLCRVLPPANDNQTAADYLLSQLGTSHPFVQWTAVRPDTLLEGDVSAYTLHEGLVSSVFAPDSCNMANVAHFMCELVASPTTWAQWRGKLPVIINASAAKR